MLSRALRRSRKLGRPKLLKHNMLQINELRRIDNTERAAVPDGREGRNEVRRKAGRMPVGGWPQLGTTDSDTPRLRARVALPRSYSGPKTTRIGGYRIP
jgi:hypothetical protein